MTSREKDALIELLMRMLDDSARYIVQTPQEKFRRPIWDWLYHRKDGEKWSLTERIIELVDATLKANFEAARSTLPYNEQGRRSPCPLCQRMPFDPYVDGWLVQEGLRWHLQGTNSVVLCPVMDGVRTLEYLKQERQRLEDSTPGKLRQRVQEFLKAKKNAGEPG